MKYKIQKGLIVQKKIDKKTVIFDGEESILYTFNETAAEIFQLLKKGFKEKEIIEKLVKKYQTKPEKIKKDLSELINKLKKNKIISVA